MSFKLSDAFIEQYKDRPVDWGFVDAGGNALGEMVFLRTYSRKKEDGTKEHWWEVCRRVIEGMFSIQKDYCKTNRLPWNDTKAHVTAKDAFERLFTLKWTPPGRGLWMMGTPLVMEQRNSAALQNCAFVSTKDIDKGDPSKPFAFLMEASMLGIGVGFDARGADKLSIQLPAMPEEAYSVPDTREGWVESVRYILRGFLTGSSIPVFDYSLIRPKGAPIKTFGGTAAGPEPLERLHEELTGLLYNKIGDRLDAATIADIGNLIGVCVVAGNVRRSAELFMGTEEQVIGLKDYDGKGAYRAEWSWMSNNSVLGDQVEDWGNIADAIRANGEPGVIFMDNTCIYGRMGRMGDNRDYRALGYNPCAEQSLESYECCTLVETYIDRHEDFADFNATLKVAYLYAKTVTLLPTHWEETNAIMQRNRRIGTSVSGVTDFLDNRGRAELQAWLNKGYGVVRQYDKTYSEWLCVRESIKTTTVKPSGTVSLLAGVSPGVHWSPGARTHIRRVTVGKDEPIAELYAWCGYNVEPAVIDPEGSVVIEVPVMSPAKRSEREVSVWEKAILAGDLQRLWSDNSVSVTLSFDPEAEGQFIEPILEWAKSNLKTVSFLPSSGHGYEQAPYEQISAQQYADATERLLPVNFDLIYDGVLDADDGAGEKFCSTDRCEIGAMDVAADNSH